ncbi:MAG: hypothetical protein ACOY3I_06710 [Verrucomicrobiota bacterium]
MASLLSRGAVVALLFSFLTHADIAQISNIPRLQGIILVEDGTTYPAVSNRDGTVQVTPGKLLKDRNLQTLMQLLENYVGWPADGSSVEAIGRAIASWGKGNAAYFNLFSPISIPTQLTLTLYPKAEGPSFLTYVQPRMATADVSGSFPVYSSSYWTDMAASDDEPVWSMGGEYDERLDQLETEKEKLKFTASKLAAKLRKGQEDKAKLKTLLNNLSQGVKDAQASTEKIRQFEEERSRLQSMLNELSQQLDEAKQLGVRVKQVEAEKQLVEEEKTKWKSTAGKLSRKLKDTQTSDHQIKKLEEEKALAEKEKRQAEVEKQMVKTETAKLKNMVEKLSRKLKETRSSDEQIKKLEAEKNQLKEMAEDLSSSLKTARRAQERVNQLEAEKQKIEQMLLQLTADIQGSSVSRVQREQATEEKDRLENMLGRLAADLRQAQAKSEKSERWEAEKNQLRAKLDELSGKLQKARMAEERVAQLEEEQTQLNATLGDLSQQVQGSKMTEAKVQQLEKEKEQLKSMLRNLSKELSQAREIRGRIQEVETEKNQLQATLEGLSRELNGAQSAQKKNKELSDSRARLKAAVRGVSSELENLKRQQTVQIGDDQVEMPSLESMASESPVREDFDEEASSKENISLIRRVIVASSEMKNAARSSRDRVVVSIGQLPTETMRRVRSAAGALLNQPFSMDAARRVGAEIGKLLRDSGLKHYDVILPQQSINDGVINIEIRRR